MKKLLLSAAVSAVVLGNVAEAAFVATVGEYPTAALAAVSNTVFISGASAATAFFASQFQSYKVPNGSKICDPTKPIFRFGDGAASLTTYGGSNQKAYLCEVFSGSSLAAANPNGILIYKRDQGGSGQGVRPIAANETMSFLTIAPGTCNVVVTGAVGTSTTDAKFTDINCSTSALATQAHFGLSDVDPIQFRGAAATGADITESQVSNLTVLSAGTLVFNTPVSLKLRNALQEAQFGRGNACVGNDTVACMPTLSSSQLASIFTGQITSWKQLKLGAASNLFDNASAANKPRGGNADTIHVCRRTGGSGTNAQFLVKFLNYPCTTSALPFGAATTSTNGSAVATTEAAGSAEALGAVFHGMSSAGTLEDCLDGLDRNVASSNFVGLFSGSRWAIGVQSTDFNKSNAKNYRFIKIDGVEPTIDKSARGQYKDWVELTYQYNTAAFSGFGAVQSIVGDIIAKGSNPQVMAAANANAKHTWGNGGYMANPAFNAAKPNGTLDVNAPSNPYSHGYRLGATAADRAPNACRAPLIYDGGTTGTPTVNSTGLVGAGAAGTDAKGAQLK